MQARRQHDGTTACAQLSPALRSQLVEQQSKPTCAEAVLQVALHGRRTEHVRVYATAAEVQLAQGDTFFLAVGRLGWRIEALGCRPAGPGPFKCEAES